MSKTTWPRLEVVEVVEEVSLNAAVSSAREVAQATTAARNLALEAMVSLSARKSRAARSLVADHAPGSAGHIVPGQDRATRDPGVTTAAEAAEDLASEEGDRAAQDTRTLAILADLTAPGDHHAAIRRDLAQDLAQAKNHAGEVPERS